MRQARGKIFKSLVPISNWLENFQHLSLRLFALARQFSDSLEILNHINLARIQPGDYLPATIMLQSQAFRSICLPSVRGQLQFVQKSRPFSSRRGNEDDEEDLNAARNWYSSFTENTIPATLSETTFSRSSGSGGQKVNK